MNTRINNDLSVRVQRLVSGQHRIEDLVRIFLDLRSRCSGKPCFREIGDFVAHRDERTKGLVTQTAQHLFTSMDVWSMKLRNIDATMEDIFNAAKANLFIATDTQLHNMVQCQRGNAKGKLKSIQKKWKKGSHFTDVEKNFLNSIGNALVWRPVFTGDSLFSEFCEVLKDNQIASKEDIVLLSSAKNFIVLFALVHMHGCRLNISNTMKVEVLVGFKKNENYLCAFMNVIFEELEKPLYFPVALFMSDLNPMHVCSSDLQTTDGAMPNTWDDSIEIGGDGRLRRM